MILDEKIIDELKKHDIIRIHELIEKAKRQDYKVCVWGCGVIGRNWIQQLLSHMSVRIDFYCDSDISLYGREIFDGIFVKSFEYLKADTDNTICFLALGSAALPEVYVRLREQCIKNIVTYDDLLLLDCAKELNFDFWNRKSIAIYTCITGEYDDFRLPELIDKDCDYYLISDKQPENNLIYKWINVDQCVPQDICDNRLKNRYCKINVHKIFPQYKYSIYLDGYLKIKQDLTVFIDRLAQTGLGVLAYREWESIYTEAVRCIQGKLEYEEPIKKQVERYWKEGMPDDFPTIICGVLIRQHHNPRCVKLMEDWWKEIITGSRRDQISLPYVLWKNGYTISDITAILDNPYSLGRYFDYTGKHNKKRM